MVSLCHWTFMTMRPTKAYFQVHIGGLKTEGTLLQGIQCIHTSKVRLDWKVAIYFHLFLTSIGDSCELGSFQRWCPMAPHTMHGGKQCPLGDKEYDKGTAKTRVNLSCFTAKIKKHSPYIMKHSILIFYYSVLHPSLSKHGDHRSLCIHRHQPHVSDCSQSTFSIPRWWEWGHGRWRQETGD